MLSPRERMICASTDACHGGQGRLTCVEMLADRGGLAPGSRFVHDDHLAPGASIGEHAHTDNEELYIILEGAGVMLIDGVPHPVRAGDLCRTGPGHSHGLTAGLQRPMRFLVVCVNLPSSR
jgi:uncharacterized cupin superfamily protein